MADPLSIPPPSEGLVDELRKPTGNWYRQLQRLFQSFNSVAGGIPTGGLGFLEGATRGDIIRRGATAWEKLAVGSSGQVLRSNGTDPAWATPASPVTPIGSGAISGGTSQVDVALGSYDMVEIDLIALEPSDDGADLNLRCSQNGGSSFLSGVADYGWGFDESAGVVDNSDSEITLHDNVGNAADERLTLTVRIFRPAASSFAKQVTWFGGAVSSAGNHLGVNGYGQLLANTNAITHARFLWSAGTFDAGFWAARGYSFT